MREYSLHKAIIENHIETVRKLAANKSLIWKTNELGLNAVDLARYLGREECLSLMGLAKERQILIRQKESKLPRPVSPEEFQDIFHSPYLETLYFQDYKTLKKVFHQCPYILRFKSLENTLLAEKHNRELTSAYMAPVSIRWINEDIHYGLFAEKNFNENEWVGEYTGVVRQYFRRRPATNEYCIHYPTKLWSLSYFMIDAALGGNEIRFVNHSDRPNTTPYCLVKNHLLHIVLFTNRKVHKNEELTFNYGKDFWRKRKKR